MWLGLFEPTPDEFAEVQQQFGLHELAVEDAIEAHQRPKLEVYDETLFVVLKTAVYRDPVEVIDFGEILVFIGDGFVVHVRHGAASPLHDARRQIELRPDLLALGPAAVLYAIVDKVVDDYFPVLNALDDAITAVEIDVFSDRRDVNPVERIYKLKREVVETYHAAVPLLDPLNQLTTQPLPSIAKEMSDYFRDVRDHLLQARQEVEVFRELLTGILEANLTRVTVRQNDDMRKISAWVAIAAFPTMVAGVYGMNFRHMPELDEPWAYPGVLALMVVVCLCLYRGFRRSGWL